MKNKTHGVFTFGEHLCFVASEISPFLPVLKFNITIVQIHYCKANFDPSLNILFRENWKKSWSCEEKLFGCNIKKPGRRAPLLTYLIYRRGQNRKQVV